MTTPDPTTPDPTTPSPATPGPTADGAAPDFAHTDQATLRRREKAVALARFAWDRAISAEELLALSDAQLRKLARAAGTHPPSSMETWKVAVGLLTQKAEWAQRNPGHPAAARAHEDEKIMWVKRPVPGWG